MNQGQTIDINHVWRPPITVTVIEDFRVRFYATTFTDTPDGPGWAPAPDGRHWRLDVPPSVYQALTVGDACGVLWRGEDLLGAMDWEAREQDPNATAYRIDPELPGGHVKDYEGDITCAADGRSALLGRVDVDPGEEWWLVIVDEELRVIN
jgi:hypothetical protein